MDCNSSVINHPRFLERKANIEAINRERKKRNRIRSVAYILIVTVMVFVISAFGRFAWSSYQLSREIDLYLSQLENAKIQNAQLLQEIEQIQDPIFIERIARERLGLVRSGERIIMPTIPGDIMPLNKPAEGEIQH